MFVRFRPLIFGQASVIGENSNQNKPLIQPGYLYKLPSIHALSSLSSLLLIADYVFSLELSFQLPRLLYIHPEQLVRNEWLTLIQLNS